MKAVRGGCQHLFKVWGTDCEGLSGVTL